MVTQGHELGFARGEGQCALEVPVEAEPVWKSAEDEALVLVQQAPHCRCVDSIRSIVDDEANPVGVRLCADRLDLTAEQIQTRIPRSHADGYEGLVRGVRALRRLYRRVGKAGQELDLADG